MRRNLAAAIGLAVLLAAAAGAAAQAGVQDLEQRRRELVKEAEKLSEQGDHIRATLLSGEAYAIEAQICWNEGRRAAAEENWREALKRGWRGAAPWGSEKPVEVQEPPQGPSLLEQEQPEPLDRPVRPRLREEIDTWPYIALSPYHHGNASVWHSLLGTPPFEEALVMPRSLWLTRAWMDLATTEFVDDTQLGITRWDATLSRENFEVDYSVTDTLLVGARVSAGELLDGGNPIRVFEGVRQIVPTAERTYGTASMTLRAKFAGNVLKYADAGVLLEVKLPLADQANLLTTQTIDVALMGLFTKTMGRFAVHANLGFVVPIGDPGIFVEGFDEVNPFVAGAVGGNMIVARWLTVGAQLEGNTSAFSDIKVLDVPVLTFTGQAHVRVGDRLFMGLSAGHGVNVFSGQFMLGASMEMTF